jgi:hypothetical protein
MFASCCHKNRLKSLGRIILQISSGAVILFVSILLVHAHGARGFEDLRGKKGCLRISEKVMLRLRCNPFWEYVSNRRENPID